MGMSLVLYLRRERVQCVAVAGFFAEAGQQVRRGRPSRCIQATGERQIDHKIMLQQKPLNLETIFLNKTQTITFSSNLFRGSIKTRCQIGRLLNRQHYATSHQVTTKYFQLLLKDFFNYSLEETLLCKTSLITSCKICERACFPLLLTKIGPLPFVLQLVIKFNSK